MRIRRLKHTPMKRSLPFALILLVFVGGLALGLYLRNSINGRGLSSSAAPAGLSPADTRPAPVAGAEPAHARGPATATITLEEFADFQCPACGKFHPVLKSIETEFGNQLRVVFREFPLPTHVHARKA